MDFFAMYAHWSVVSFGFGESFLDSRRIYTLKELAIFPRHRAL
jgi:hypothetical protein